MTSAKFEAQIKIGLEAILMSVVSKCQNVSFIYILIVEIIQARLLVKMFEFEKTESMQLTTFGFVIMKYKHKIGHNYFTL